MASLIKRPNGHFWIQYKAPGSTRKTIRLGPVGAPTTAPRGSGNWPCGRTAAGKLLRRASRAGSR